MPKVPPGPIRDGLFWTSIALFLGMILMNWHLLAVHLVATTVSFILIGGGAAGLIWNYYAQRS